MSDFKLEVVIIEGVKMIGDANPYEEEISSMDSDNMFLYQDLCAMSSDHHKNTEYYPFDFGFDMEEGDTIDESKVILNNGIYYLKRDYNTNNILKNI